MGLRLAVERDAWTRQLERTVAALPGVVPVVKGNGYGFGRTALMPFAVQHTPADGQIAVGTVYEAADVPAGRTPLVLTPHVDALPEGLRTDAVLTVGSGLHVAALERHGWQGPVAVKLASSMQRYGVAPEVLHALLGMISATGWSVDSYSIHFPLVGTPESHLAEILQWVAALRERDDGDPPRPISISHLPSDEYAVVRERHPEIEWRHRAGTSLWHGDKRLLHLTADVLDVRPVAAGEAVGYRGVATPARGHLVMVAAGSAHGVRNLDDGRSPFHHARQRLTLLEPPHMHTSMLFVPHGDPVPAVGERVDVQRPLTTTSVDELVWLP
jgi:alanine racemase